MPASDEPKSAGEEPAQGIHDSETVVPAYDDSRGEPADAENRSSPAAFATPVEFSRALVELGLVDQAELDGFAAESAEGVVGLSRALVKAGRVTPYQAAAVYQQKSRGLLIGNYLILDKLGQGGMGVVFKARHRRLGRIGALKILPPSFARDKSAVLRFRREVEAAGRLKHPNLVAALDADEDRGVHFLVMDYVEGRDLDHVVRERGPLPVGQAVDSLIQAARGLAAAHAEGIIHRDIKPGNLMLEHAGTVRVLDLGLARIVESANPFNKTAARRLTESGMYMGTIDFMAPEQAEDSHRVDGRADIYSLGCTLFYLLTGREPFPGETVLKRLLAHMERPAPSLRLARPDVPAALDLAYEKMMAKRPGDRPASMTALISLLEAAKTALEEAAAQARGTAPGALRESKPELKVFDEANLKRAGAPRTKTEASVFARPKEAAGLAMGKEISLEDLVMDVRPEPRPAPLPAAPKRAAGEPPMLKRRAPATRRRTGARRAVLGLAAPAVLLAAVAGFLVWRNGARPDPEVAATRAADTKRGNRATTESPPPATKRAPSVPGTQTARAEPRGETKTMTPTAPKTTTQTAPTGNLATTGKTPKVTTKPSRVQAAPTARPAIPPVVVGTVVVGTTEITKRLEKPIRLHFPNETPFSDVLKYIKSATKQGPDDPGIPIYVDPLGLEEARKTMFSTVKIDVDGVPLRSALKELLGQLGLVHLVKDDVLIVSSPMVIDAQRRQQMSVAADTSSATKAVLAKLEQPVVMPFGQSTPLSDVLKYIKSATKQGPNDPGIPTYADAAAFKKAEKTLSSTVRIELEGVPLKTSLSLLLKQLGLTYVVRNGALSITSSNAIRGPQSRRRN
jgi:hypothetical protein